MTTTNEIVRTGWYNGNQKPIRSGYYLVDYRNHNRPAKRGKRFAWFDTVTGKWGKSQPSAVPSPKRGFRNGPSVWQRCKWQGWYKDANIPDTMQVPA